MRIVVGIFLLLVVVINRHQAVSSRNVDLIQIVNGVKVVERENVCGLTSRSKQ